MKTLFYMGDDEMYPHPWFNQVIYNKNNFDILIVIPNVTCLLTKTLNLINYKDTLFRGESYITPP